MLLNDSLDTAIFSNMGTNTNRISQIIFNTSYDTPAYSIMNDDGSLYEWRTLPSTQPGDGTERVKNVIYNTAYDLLQIYSNSSWHYFPSRTVLANHLATQDYNYNYTISAGGTYNTAFNPTKSGYSCLGIIRFSTNSVDVVPVNMNIGTGSYSVAIRNVSSSSKTGTLSLTALFVKTY